MEGSAYAGLAPTPSFVRAVADFETQSLVYNDESRLELVGPLFDNYGAIAGIRDLACGLSGRDKSPWSPRSQAQTMTHSRSNERPPRRHRAVLRCRPPPIR